MEPTTTRRFDTAAERWAGVGPYYAMFPVSFANRVIQEYTRVGDWILDPFAGRGTALFAAASQNRFGFGVEINPVGWVYGRAKLHAAEREDVERVIRRLGQLAPMYREEAAALPEFFKQCFCPAVRRYLLAARHLLDWRRRQTDWTTMALLLIDLHGKRENSLSNQMRQTKAMSPQYAIQWWREHGLFPPERDPVEFMLKKVAWRYAKGRLKTNESQMYLGDSQNLLTRLCRRIRGGSNQKAKLLFTSPPYHGVTNYFYDQWLRLWLLGGFQRPHSSGEKCERKFENKQHYLQMLHVVFSKCKGLLGSGAVVYVRTDARKFTLEATLQTLEEVFHDKKLRHERHSLPTFTQTALFHSSLASKGEVDLILW